MQTGRIINALAGFYDVQTSDEQIYRTRARGEFRKSKQKPLVGDFVEFDSNNGDGFIWKINERKNSLVRPPIANIDLAVVVTAVKEPNLTLGLLDRQLVALEAENIQPLIYFSKTDLLTDDEFNKMDEIIDYYRDLYPLVFEKDLNVAYEKLKAMLSKKVVTFMGQTGAGKSTLLNHLSPKLNLETGEVSKALSRGKHTTRKVTLIPVHDALIADTPGFSSYEVFNFDVTELNKFFPDILKYSIDCRFRTCQHLNEPNCAVKEAVANREILESRYLNYQNFYGLMSNQKPTYGKKNK